LLALSRYAGPLVLAAILLTWGGPVWSGVSGKLAGTITDAATGEPLPGATIKVVGTQIATEADSDGEFYIINLPVGTHTVSVSRMGYETVIVQEIRVLMDLTTPMELTLTKTPIDLKKTVTVVAKRPLIQRDNTSSGSIVTRDEISYRAGNRNITSVISTMAGTVMGSDGGLHVRGGRRGTVNYFFDGYSIQDPFTGDMGIRIVPDALEELSLTSGGLSPEYGEALSGVVNAITREGGANFHGRVKTYEGASHAYDVNTGTYGSLDLTNTRSVVMDASGPLFRLDDRLATFFAGIETVRDDGWLPHSRSKLFSSVGKIALYPTTRTKVTLNGSYYFNDRQYYEHRDVNGFSYDFNLDGLGKIENEAYLIGLKANFTKSANTVYSVNFSRFRTWTKEAPEHLFDKHWDEWPGYSEDSTGEYNGWIQDSNYVVSPDYAYIGFTEGDDYYPYYLEKSAVYNGAKFSMLSQIDRHNQITFGGDLRRFELDWDNRQFFNAKPYGETYEAFPWYGAAFVQDKIELNDMVVNLGLRFDYMHSDVSYWHDPFVKDYQKTSKPKVQWSPRLGISHPVSENSVLHFNYGYLFQPPQARLMYTNLQGDLETGYPLIGNPDLDAEKTIYYELGWTRLISNSLRVSATTYYRDIRNMIGAREVVDDDGNIYTVFTNSDYGSCKGFDLAVENIGPRLLSWSAEYSYMIARGNASDPREWYYDYFTATDDARPTLPTREYPLAYDQRHNLTIEADFRVPRGEHPRLIGFSLPDAWGVNVLGHYGSGLAYTRTDKTGYRVGQLNGERMPYTLRFDARFNRNFYLGPATGACLSLFVEVENLFDRRNVVDVYTSTGSPDNDGLMALNVNSPTYEQEKLWYTLMSRDPQNYQDPRTVRVGLEFKF